MKTRAGNQSNKLFLLACASSRQLRCLSRHPNLRELTWHSEPKKRTRLCCDLSPSRSINKQTTCLLWGVPQQNPSTSDLSEPQSQWRGRGQGRTAEESRCVKNKLTTAPWSPFAPPQKTCYKPCNLQPITLTAKSETCEPQGPHRTHEHLERKAVINYKNNNSHHKSEEWHTGN